ncbi:uncharacterized protein DMAD_11348 [Drosophila madeirensis]|uniref:Kazal-like domain-containing protein n=1 Tax=Drosophila madeirensis TaxID=30013 RepID=A0AAU9FCV6_DROMD
MKGLLILLLIGLRNAENEACSTYCHFNLQPLCAYDEHGDAKYFGNECMLEVANCKRIKEKLPALYKVTQGDCSQAYK